MDTTRELELSVSRLTRAVDEFKTEASAYKTKEASVRTDSRFSDEGRAEKLAEIAAPAAASAARAGVVPGAGTDVAVLREGDQARVQAQSADRAPGRGGRRSGVLRLTRGIRARDELRARGGAVMELAANMHLLTSGSASTVARKIHRPVLLGRCSVRGVAPPPLGPFFFREVNGDD